MNKFCTHRLFMSDYSPLASLPLVPGRVFYAPQVSQFLSYPSFPSQGAFCQDFSRRSATACHSPLLPTFFNPSCHSGISSLSEIFAFSLCFGKGGSSQAKMFWSFSPRNVPNSQSPFLRRARLFASSLPRCM